jgi:hypothetical protein
MMSLLPCSCPLFSGITYSLQEWLCTWRDDESMTIAKAYVWFLAATQSMKCYRDGVAKPWVWDLPPVCARTIYWKSWDVLRGVVWIPKRLRPEWICDQNFVRSARDRTYSHVNEYFLLYNGGIETTECPPRPCGRWSNQNLIFLLATGRRRSCCKAIVFQNSIRT